MTREEFDIITNKIGCWFTHLKLNSFRKTFDGEIYPSSALGTDYGLFIHKLEKELSFEDKPSLPSNLDEAAREIATDILGKDYLSELDEDCAIDALNEAIELVKAGAEWMAGQGWHDARETPSIFGVYLVIHEKGWCVANYFGKGSVCETGWCELVHNIPIEHPQKWFDLRDLIPKRSNTL